MTDRGSQARYAFISGIGRAIGNPNRLMLLHLVADGPRSVEDIAHEAGLTVANASQHLRLLSSAGLAQGIRKGNYVFYAISDETVLHLIRSLEDFADRRLAEMSDMVKAYADAREDLEPLGIDSLIQAMASGSVVVMDVRPEEEYAQGHIPGAVSLPHTDIADRLSELDADREIVAYCRGRYCVLARKASEMLRARGFAVRVMQGGMEAWRDRGLPVHADSSAN